MSKRLLFLRTHCTRLYNCILKSNEENIIPYIDSIDSIESMEESIQELRNLEIVDSVEKGTEWIASIKRIETNWRYNYTQNKIRVVKSLFLHLRLYEDGDFKIVCYTTVRSEKK